MQDKVEKISDEEGTEYNREEKQVKLAIPRSESNNDSSASRQPQEALVRLVP